MASIISVDTLQDSAGSNEVTTANVKTAFDDRVKAWHRFDASSGSPVTGDSLNISSTTDDGTGIFTPAFTNNFSNTEYSVGACGSNGNASLTSFNLAFYSTNTNNFGLRMHKIISNAVSLFDSEYNAYAINGDLA